MAKDNKIDNKISIVVMSALKNLRDIGVRQTIKSIDKSSPLISNPAEVWSLSENTEYRKLVSDFYKDVYDSFLDDIKSNAGSCDEVMEIIGGRELIYELDEFTTNGMKTFNKDSYIVKFPESAYKIACTTKLVAKGRLHSFYTNISSLTDHILLNSSGGIVSKIILDEVKKRDFTVETDRALGVIRVYTGAYNVANINASLNGYYLKSEADAFGVKSKGTLFQMAVNAAVKHSIDKLNSEPIFVIYSQGKLTLYNPITWLHWDNEVTPLNIKKFPQIKDGTIFSLIFSETQCGRNIAVEIRPTKPNDVLGLKLSDSVRGFANLLTKNGIIDHSSSFSKWGRFIRE